METSQRSSTWAEVSTKHNTAISLRDSVFSDVCPLERLERKMSMLDIKMYTYKNANDSIPTKRWISFHGKYVVCTQFS